MKLAHIVAIGAMSSLGLLAYTNPGMDRYERYIQQQVIRAAKAQGGIAPVFGSLFGRVAGSLVANATVRNDYVFFSTYETDLGGEPMRAVGALNNFYLLEAPRD